MARARVHRPLNIFLNGRKIGVLRRESSGAIDFRYDDTWLAWESAMPVSLSLPLREDRYVGTTVLNVFDNLLPDAEVIRRRIAERVGARGTDAYSLLAAVGQDCVGALQFLLDGTDPGPTGVVEGNPVSPSELAEIIRNLSSAPLGLRGDDTFRISIAGVQEKTALLRYKGDWHRPTGPTATTHILKPRIGRLPNGIDLSNSVENEFFCLKLLSAFGVPTADVEIADFDDVRTLIVERFDRHWTRDNRLIRLPQEDCCQALSVSPTMKYQADGGPGMIELLELLKRSDKPEEDISVFFRAVIGFWLLGATDGHAKNFSVFLSPGGRFRMTPVYDVLSTQPNLDARQIPRNQFKLAMSVGTNRHYVAGTITPRHFLQSAAMAGVGESLVRSILDSFRDHVGGWTHEVVSRLPAGFPQGMVDSITKGVLRRARTLD